MKIFIKKDPKKGRGVFATDKINKGELIESCHLILMDLHDVTGTLEGYVYQYSRDKAAVALGNGSLLNHSDEANSEFHFDYRKKMLVIEARRDILPGEEVTINYRYTPQDKKRFNIHS
jgi:SET domain-containing protein